MDGVGRFRCTVRRPQHNKYKNKQRTLPSVSGDGSEFSGLVGVPRRRKTESHRQGPATAAVGGGAAPVDAMVKEYDGHKYENDKVMQRIDPPYFLIVVEDHCSAATRM